MRPQFGNLENLFGQRTETIARLAPVIKRQPIAWALSEQLSSIDVADWYLADMFGSATISAFQRRADIP
jgi:hypothetical protein